MEIFALFVPRDGYLWGMRDLLAKPRIGFTGAGRQIHWYLGTLQFAPSLNSPWIDLPAASPFALSPIA